MRKVILLAILIASLTGAKAQLNFNATAGISSLKVPVAGASFQYNLHHFIIAAGFDAQVTQKASVGNLYWTRLGAAIPLNDFNSVEIAAGIGNYGIVIDYKELNKGLGLLSAFYVHQMKLRPEGAVIAGITATKEFILISGGLRFIFGQGSGGNKFGCSGARVR